MELGFGINIETDQSESEITRTIAAALKGAQQEGGYIQYKDNLLVVHKTFSHDREKIFTDNNPWFYYRFELSVSPLKATDLETQKQLAGELMSSIKKHVEFAYLIANFEI